MTLTPDSYGKFAERAATTFDVVSVFLDADDAVLDSRLRIRDSKNGIVRDQSSTWDRRSHDRSFRGHATYILRNKARVEDTVAAIRTLLRIWDRSGVLPRQVLQSLLRGGQLLDQAEAESVQSASYDLRLGDEYYYAGEIRNLTEKSPMLIIEPYDSAIVTSVERAQMPRDVTARFDLSVGLFSQGVILSNGPQIDPGFEGTLFCLLFNTSSSPVLLRRGQHYATMEFSKLLEPSTAPYAGARQGKDSIIDYLSPNAARGAINELKKDLESLKKEGARLQAFFIAALTLMFAISALFISGR